MNFSFGEKIKSLRKGRNLTQENLAEVFGVSFQAVSKWETNVALPDVMMFPVIANFFGVTTDELLGVDVSKTRETVKQICDEVDLLFGERKFSEALAIMNKAINDYVGYEELQYRLAWALSGNIKENPNYLDEALNVYLKILDTTTNNEMRSRVIRDLVYRYYTKNDVATAMTFAKQLAPFDVCLEYVIGRANILDGQELADYLKANVRLFGKAIIECLEYMTNYNILSKEQIAPQTTETAKEKIELMKKVIQID